MKKKFLIISYSYPPANSPAAQRPYALAKYLDKSKFDVFVLTCGNADSSMGFDDGFDENIKNVTLIKVDDFLGKKASGIRNHRTVASNAGIIAKIKSKAFVTARTMLFPDRAIFWLPNVYKYLKNNPIFLDSIDVLFSTSPLFSNHLAALYIKKRNNKLKWIADIRDFHYIEHIEHKSILLGLLHKTVEKKVLKKTDYVTVVSEIMKQKFENRYPKYASKFNLLYNGFDLDDFRQLDIKPLTGDTLDIFYAGSFYSGVRTPVPLFKLLDIVFEEKIISPENIKVYIAGTMDEHLSLEINKYKSAKCMEYLGRIPRSEVLYRLTNTHLLWLIIGHTKLHSIGIPIKLYEYIAAKRPILCFAPHTAEPANVVRENNLGWVIDDKADAIEIQVNNFKDIVASFKKGTLQQPLSIDALKKFNREQQAEIIARLINK
ncbi:hypothetical protein ULMS_27130 [Patiriisocius marinistellae]|uniref:Glycosyltransferase n=1 Tax=Patiriisocius marinistellae TaxID=2494560 RepID=A0A5J4G389_9FLAO|nr:hypothetical protein [Patiriisocius marinistellae]GEQ87205.1 hypothetical protein ULMS_27130 [Patiriisocius marinistellae]